MILYPHDVTTVDRRIFLKSLTFGALALPLAARNGQEVNLETIFHQIRLNILKLINDEREVEKLQDLEFDDLATKVATTHATDMAQRDFASHWGSNGLKPYMRYSFAGGAHATQENVSAADNTWSMKSGDLIQDTSYLHVRLYEEKPPNDGHRKAILAPQHTHVGLGLAVDKLHLRMVELFVSKYVEIKPLRQTAKPKETLQFSGRLLKSSYILNNIEVFYEPLPTNPELEWLRQPRSYSLPDESVVLVPKLMPPFIYADAKTGVINLNRDGTFSTPIKLFNSAPGIYTIVCWVRRSSSEKAFAATEFCVRAE